MKAGRVAFVSPNYYLNTVGGADVQVFLMANALAQRGRYDVSYVTPDLEATGVVDKLKIVRIPKEGIDKNSSQARFFDTLDTLKPDLLFQVGRKLFTQYTAAYSAARGIPFIFRATSDIDGRLFRQVSRIFSEHPFRRVVNPARVIRETAMDLRTYRAMSKATVVIAQTEKQKVQLARLLKKKVVLVQNMHEVPLEQDIVKDDPPLVLWLASMKSVKRPGLFLEIARQLEEERYRIVMAGRMNEEQFRTDVSGMCESPNFEYIEHVSFEESNNLIARARVFVLTSSREGLPNTLIQSWLRWTPTVSLGVDPDGMISSNDLGMHVDSVEDAVSAIKALLKDENLYRRKASAARSFAVANFGLEQQIELVTELIDEVLNPA